MTGASSNVVARDRLARSRHHAQRSARLLGIRGARPGAEEVRTRHTSSAAKIVAEEHWMRYGVTARRKRNRRRVGELAALRKDFASTAAASAP